MVKYLFIFLASIIFVGCNPISGSSKVYVDAIENNISTPSTETSPSKVDAPVIDDNVVVNQNTTIAPHRKSSIPMLGVLVSYKDVKISSDDSVWSAKLFGKSEHQLNHYYSEASNSQFEFIMANEDANEINDGIISVELDQEHPNTDISNYLFESKTYPDLREALEALDDKVDFSNYDNDANGHITPDELLLTFIIAGYEDSYEGSHVTNGIWAHQYCMTSASNVAALDGVSLMGCQNGGNFALFGELHDRREPHDATIGIIAHELGHSAFSLPDLYNTTDSYGGIGYFGIMGAGTWTSQEHSEHAGNTPVHFSAWSKIQNGWVIPTEENGTATLSETSSSSYNVIKVPISANSYYLIENRNNSGYDKGLNSLSGEFDGGIAIWQIDETKLTPDYIERNMVNADSSAKAVDLVEAANAVIDEYEYAGGDAKALFYSDNVDSFGSLITEISPRSSQMTLNIN